MELTYSAYKVFVRCLFNSWFVNQFFFFLLSWVIVFKILYSISYNFLNICYLNEIFVNKNFVNWAFTKKYKLFDCQW